MNGLLEHSSFNSTRTIKKIFYTCKRKYFNSHAMIKFIRKIILRKII